MKNERRTVSVQVQAKDGDVPLYLTRGCEWSADPGEQVRFVFHASPTVRERSAITKALHEVAGGLREFTEITQARFSVGAKLRARLEAALWPDGKPEAKTAEAIKLLDDRLEQAWGADASEEKALWVQLSAVIERLEWMARWSVLIVDPPPGWESLADVEIGDDLAFLLLRESWSAAFAETSLGKRKPSAY